MTIFWETERKDVTEMQYMLIFKAYLGGQMKAEEWHYFTNLSDLYSYAAARLKFVGGEGSYDQYDIQVRLAKADNTSPAA